MIKDGPTIYHTGDTDVFEDMKLMPMFHRVTSGYRHQIRIGTFYFHERKSVRASNYVR